MSPARTRNIRTLKLSLWILAAVAVTAYAVWRSLPYAKGPRIDIFEPLSGATIASTTAVLSGHVERVNSLTINGDAVSMDERGDFKRLLVIFKGANVWTLSATDQFGRSISKQVEVLGM